MIESEKEVPEGLPENVRSEKIKTSDPRDHYVQLDGVRGIAILAENIQHFGQLWMWTGGAQVPLTFPPLITEAFFLFYAGLPLGLFFILSGYLLTWTEEKRARRGSYSVRSYALRRAFRIVPAYYFAILLVILVWPIDVSVRDVLMHISFLHGLDPGTVMSLNPAFWSLTVEVVFYALLPFLILKLPRLSQRLTLFGVLFLVSLATRLYVMLHSADQLTLQSGDFNLVGYLAALPTTHLYLFIAGMLLRMVFERLGAHSMARLRLLFTSILFLVFPVSSIVLLYLLQHPDWLGPGGILALLFSSMLLKDAALVVIFASVLVGLPLLRGLLRWRPVSFVGTMSYSLFLLHNTIWMVLFSHLHLGDSVWEWLVGRGDLMIWSVFLAYLLGCLAAAIAISYLSYRYIESPFLRYKPK